MQCGCGFSTEYPNCNGTHKTVKLLKDKIIEQIEAIPMGDDNNQLNAVGMKMLIIDIVRKVKGV